jgi:hypothetical protein
LERVDIDLLDRQSSCIDRRARVNELSIAPQRCVLRISRDKCGDLAGLKIKTAKSAKIDKKDFCATAGQERRLV